MKRRGPMGSARAASEVISVLLMVAVTIVLAAMVGSVLLDIVSDVDDNPLAAANVNFDGGNEEIRVVYTATQQNGTTLEVKAINETTDAEIPGSPKTIPEVGDSRTFNASDGLASGNEYTVRVIAKAPGGEQAVVGEQDGSL